LLKLKISIKLINLYTIFGKNLKQEKIMKNKTYIFFRADRFCFVVLKDDNDAIINAIHSKDTLKVEDMTGKIIWEKQTFEN
jgi:hypothetical protein